MTRAQTTHPKPRRQHDVHPGGYRRSEVRTLRKLPGDAIAATLALALLTACGAPGVASDGASTKGATASGEFGVSEVPSVASLVSASDKLKTFKNAVYNDYPPETYQDANGKLIGVQVDLMSAIATVSGLKIQNEPVGAFDSIIPGLASRRYDLASSFFGVTQERIAQVDFVTQVDVGTSFAVKAGSGSIKAALDLCGLRVAVTAGMTFIPLLASMSDKCTSQGKPAIDTKIFPRQADGVIAVKNSRTDAVAGSTDQIGYLAKQDSAVKFEPYVVQPVPQGIAFPKDSPLTKVVQAALQELITNGAYSKIMAKWGLQDLAWTAPSNVKINNVKPSS